MEELPEAIGDAAMSLVIALLSELDEAGVVSLHAVGNRVSGMREFGATERARAAAGKALLALSALTGPSS